MYSGLPKQHRKITMKITKNIDELVKDIYKEVYNYQKIEITGIAINTKNVKKGDVFVCISGYESTGGEKRTNTHPLFHEAIDNGAVAIIAEQSLTCPPDIPLFIVEDSWRAISQISSRFFNYDPDYFRMIGVTGTNGKTSITYILENILKEAGEKVGVMGTINNRLLDKVEETNNTTPEAPVVHSFLNDARQAKVKNIVLEVTSHALELKRVDALRFDAAIFTNLTQDHLNFHDNFESYYLAKEKLFKNHLKSRDSISVINRDDPRFDRLKKACSGKVVTFGIENPADYSAFNIKYSTSNSEFECLVGNQKFSVKVPLVGKHYISNTLASIACAHSLGIPMSTILAGVSKTVVPGRFEVVSNGQPYSVIIDFAHSPDALKNSLEQARVINPNKIISVFGCGGDRDRKKRPIMGQIAEALSDYIIITSDNPRSEPPESIIDEIESGMNKKNHEKICNRKDAIRRALELARKGDLVIILGRGHEEYQKIKDEKIAFNDKKVTETLLAEQGYIKEITKNKIL